MDDKQILQSIQKVVGNRGAFAGALGFEHGEVISNWKSRGIPQAHRPAVLALALQHGIEIDPAEFLGVPGLKIENSQQEGGIENGTNAVER